MRNIGDSLKRHYKVIIIYAIGIGLGIMLALANNGIQQHESYQAVTMQVNNNWAFISVTLLTMLSMVIVGFIAGRKYE